MVHIRRNEGRGVAILEPAGEIDVTLVEAIKNSMQAWSGRVFRLILDCKGGCRVPYLVSGFSGSGSVGFRPWVGRSA
jgi:hypothetical protein